jgi:uncharacterized membrane protein YphA (DoxX/SURF4 family)
MKALLFACRILVGSTFIISGLIKANDPLGFSYKLNDYFAESALNLPFLEPSSLTLAIIACLAEIILGFAVLFGGKMKLATWLLLLLIVFFGWLTAYTATCDPNKTYTVIENGKEIQKNVTCVTDCGCFGDALKGSLGRSLTPWESFIKDLILFVLLIPIFIKRSSIKLNNFKDDLVLFSGSMITLLFFCWVFSWYFPAMFFLSTGACYLLIKKFVPVNKAEWSMAAMVAVFSFAFTYYCYAHLPVKDYRPYAIGKSIVEQMTIPKGAPQPVYENTLIYKNSKTGEVKEFPQSNYPWDDTTWVWQDTKSKLVKKGFEPVIHDFKIADFDGNDLTDGLLNDPEYIFMWVAYDLEHTNKDAHIKFNKFAEQCFKNGVSVVGLTASPYNVTEDFRHEIQAMFDYYSMDATTLKTMIRSNPGLILLKKGSVINHWHHNDVPDFKDALPKN